MTFADKIIKLRKKEGWSQEELAEKMDVSRQAVSKWEAAQTMPDLEKVLQLARLFGVTTDYLLKDEVHNEEPTCETEVFSQRKLSMAEAQDYLAKRKTAAVRIAVATLLCVLSVFPLLILGAASEAGLLPFSEDVAGAIGLISLLPPVAVAVLLYVSCGLQKEPYDFLEKGAFSLEHGVRETVERCRAEYRGTFVLYNSIGALLCVLSPISLFCGTLTGSDFWTVVALCGTLLIAGVGVMLFILAGVRWESAVCLLKTQATLEEKHKRGRLYESLTSLYWLFVTGAYLAWSFLSGHWHYTWIVWPIAAVLSGVLESVFEMRAGQKEEQKEENED